MPDGEPLQNEPAPASRRSASGWLKPVVFLVLVAGLFVVMNQFLPLADYIRGFLEWVRSVGFVGALALGGFYVIATVLLVPGSILTLAAGFVFGVLWGTVVVSIASTTGAAAAFLVGRTVARDWVARKVAGRPKFAAIDEAVGREGFKIVLLTRLSPIFPFNLLNYAFGLTRVKFRHYLLASWIGMLPGTVMYVYFGSAMEQIAQVLAGEAKGGLAERIFFWVGLAVAVAVAFFVTHVARRALKRAVPKAAADDTGTQDQEREGV